MAVDRLVANQGQGFKPPPDSKVANETASDRFANRTVVNQKIRKEREKQNGARRAKSRVKLRAKTIRKKAFPSFAKRQHGQVHGHATASVSLKRPPLNCARVRYIFGGFFVGLVWCFVFPAAGKFRFRLSNGGTSSSSSPSPSSSVR